MTNPYVWGTGRRKTAVARVRIKSGGSGAFVVNGKKFEDFFTTDESRRAAMAPLVATEMTASYDVWANVSGGGITGQSDAVKLGLARALKLDHPEFEHELRENHLLTRDARKVERKKYGLRKARRATQFSKR
ncbi:MAG: 30S ribosomal protein S9 [Planctomycetes bacterium]|nr:30S ribosomal protein S9 [Planctomycetota bacterium]MCB9868359.1 30S ribosomal protein S9 [Planctomycetota bacterium]